MSAIQPFAPTGAKYFDLIQQTFALTNDELAMLAQNGFVVSDRLNCSNFAFGYAYLHWRDLPVLITTDSLLHAMHQGFDDMLRLTEESLLIDSLRQLLLGCHQVARQMKEANSDPALDPLLDDLIVFFAVPLIVLGDPDPLIESMGTQPDALPPEVAHYTDIVRAAEAVKEIDLFGNPREIDFTLFKPRGHYTKSHQLRCYFRAQSWLQQIDFRLVAFDRFGTPRLQPAHIAAATLLLNILAQSEQQAMLDRIETLLTGIFGPSDNTTLRDFERFLADASISNPIAALTPSDPDRLMSMLLSGTYGQQRIAGQLQYAGPRHVSLFLMGARFIIDGLITSEVVYDRLIVNGAQVYRSLPHPMDVLYALGNDRALVHLADELATYGHLDTLKELRKVVAREAEQRTDTLYYAFLHTIRALNSVSQSEGMPSTLRSEAWQDKLLHTQLAAWAQIRHDSILYAKQSFTSKDACSYPAGYVEPYPAFYAAIADYARQGLALFLPHSRAALNQRQDKLHEELTRQESTLTFTEEEQTVITLADHLRADPALISDPGWRKKVAEWLGGHPDDMAARLQDPELAKSYCQTIQSRAQRIVRSKEISQHQCTDIRRDIELLDSMIAVDIEGTVSSADQIPERWTMRSVPIVMHFAVLCEVAQVLQAIAEKELAHQALTVEEAQFLKDTMFYRSERFGSGGPSRYWAGWYPRLYHIGNSLLNGSGLTEPAACVADIHTKPSDGFDPYARVLHIANGRAAMGIMLVDGIDEPTLYVGPTSTYYDFVTAGKESQRMTDETWRAKIDEGTDLPVPQWTRSFRVAPEQLPPALSLS
jgi:hypothetical protein